jgi:hypothetical protein
MKELRAEDDEEEGDPRDDVHLGRGVSVHKRTRADTYRHREEQTDDRQRETSTDTDRQTDRQTQTDRHRQKKRDIDRRWVSIANMHKHDGLHGYLSDADGERRGLDVS